MRHVGACVLCDRPLTAGVDSSEHILLQALGGRRQVRGFICTNCNSQTGQEWDAVLCRQLANIAMMHGVDRQRSGDLPAVKVTRPNGERLLVFANGLMAPAKPTYQASETERGTSVTITARSEPEARQMVRQLARRNPSIDVEAVMSTMKVTTTPNEEFLHFQFEAGGPQAGRSIVKTALAMAHAAGIGHQHCSSILPYLRGDDVEPPFGIFCERDLVRGRPAEHLIHCVAIAADPVRRLALAYVEHFGLLRYVVLLSNDYSGQAVRQVYAIDPRSGAEIEIDVDLDLSDEEIKRVTTGDGYTTETYRSVVDGAMPILLRLSEERASEATVDAAFQHAADELGIKDGDVLNEDQARELSIRIARQLTPYVLAVRRRSAGIGPGSKAEAAEDDQQ